jgi:uncharacterized protein YndB with AHSA1/START domain
VTAILHSIDIARSQAHVFSVVTDMQLLPEWQESLVRARFEGNGPVAVGSEMTQMRRVGKGERIMTTEVTEYAPPNRFAFWGTDGPIRPHGEISVDDIGGGRSRVTIKLDFEGHGIGKLLVPLVVRRQAKQEIPRNLRRLRGLLESNAA